MPLFCFDLTARIAEIALVRGFRDACLLQEHIDVSEILHTGGADGLCKPQFVQDKLLPVL